MNMTVVQKDPFLSSRKRGIFEVSIAKMILLSIHWCIIVVDISTSIGETCLLSAKYKQSTQKAGVKFHFQFICKFSTRSSISSHGIIPISLASHKPNFKSYRKTISSRRSSWPAKVSQNFRSAKTR